MNFLPMCVTSKLRQQITDYASLCNSLVLYRCDVHYTIPPWVLGLCSFRQILQAISFVKDFWNLSHFRVVVMLRSLSDRTRPLYRTAHRVLSVMIPRACVLGKVGENKLSHVCTETVERRLRKTQLATC